MNSLFSSSTKYGVMMSILAHLVIATPQLSFAQTVDTSKAVEVTEQENEIEKKHSPQLATALSTALPGLGQIYNKKYWKVPVIYAGIGALLYSINFNSTEYNVFKEAYSLRIDEDSTTVDDFEFLTDDQLLNNKDYYRRNRDISYIFMGVLYMLNIVDAAVDAHFFNYKITDDLSLDIYPAIFSGHGQATRTGIGMTLRL